MSCIKDKAFPSLSYKSSLLFNVSKYWTPKQFSIFRVLQDIILNIFVLRKRKIHINRFVMTLLCMQTSRKVNLTQDTDHTGHLYVKTALWWTLLLFLFYIIRNHDDHSCMLNFFLLLLDYHWDLLCLLLFFF